MLGSDCLINVGLRFLRSFATGNQGVRGLYFSQKKLVLRLESAANDMSIQKNHSDFCDSRFRIEVFSDSNNLVDLIISIIS